MLACIASLGIVEAWQFQFSVHCSSLGEAGQGLECSRIVAHVNSHRDFLYFCEDCVAKRNRFKCEVRITGSIDH